MFFLILMQWIDSDKISLFRAMNSIDEEDALDDEAEDLEEDKSELGSSDNNERNDDLDELEEFRHSNADCASEDVIFIDDSGETIEGDKAWVETGTANANKNMAKGDNNEIKVR